MKSVEGAFRVSRRKSVISDEHHAALTDTNSRVCWRVCPANGRPGWRALSVFGCGKSVANARRKQKEKERNACTEDEEGEERTHGQVSHITRFSFRAAMRSPAAATASSGSQQQVEAPHSPSRRPGPGIKGAPGERRVVSSSRGIITEQHSSVAPGVDERDERVPTLPRDYVAPLRT